MLNPVRTKPWSKYPIIGDDEKRAVLDVLDSGVLQGFVGSKGPGFLGGPKVRAFEQLVADYHNVEFAISFTSATAALHGAVVACGVEPLSEVIVTPYSFNTSATAPLMHNAIPVFADVTADNFGLDPESVKSRITERTQAIIPVHLFGAPVSMDEILEVSRQHNLRVIEDCAQAPGALYKGQQVGTLGDCGVFSFVSNKHASSGEGGMLITDDYEIARVARLVRNHGDALYEPMLGYNYRMTEYQAALAAVQWGKLDKYTRTRVVLADYLSHHLGALSGITVPKVPSFDQHVYYVYPLLYDVGETGIPRDAFVELLKDQGIPCGAGYIKPLNLLPLFEQRAHFAYRYYIGGAQYGPGVCPVAEELWRERLIVIGVVRPSSTYEDMDDIVRAFRRILD